MLKDTKQLVSLIFTTQRLIWEQFKKRDKMDLASHIQLAALYYIAEEKKPTMKKVADFLCVTPPSATSIINKLVKNKNIKRINDPEDRRVVRLSITQAGGSVLKTGLDLITRQMQNVLMKLGKEDRDDLARIFKKLSFIYNK